MAVKQERQLNYEVLRIIAMIMIVCLHYLSKGGLLGNPARADITATGYMVWLIEAFCLVAVNVYVLISGYFGIDTFREGMKLTSKDVVKRPFKIWRQVFFYSAVIGIFAFAAGIQEFDIYQLFMYIFPIVTEHYWFATSYVILCLLMPFLNAGFAHLDRKGVRSLILGLLVLFGVSKTVIPMQLPWDKYGYDHLWFVILYLTGAYIRRYGIGRIKGRVRAFCVYLISELLIFASFIVIRAVFFKTGRLEDMINYGYTYNYLFCYTGAIGLFLTFAQQEGRVSGLEKFRKSIELFSGATFGVYLLHEHMNIRNQWTKWFHCEEQMNNPPGIFLLHMICTVTIVYLVCSCIEILRGKLLLMIKKQTGKEE